MKNENYLAEWIIGNLSDSQLVKIEGQVALDKYLLIKSVSSKLSIDIPQTLQWSHFSKTLPEKKAPKTISMTWIYSLAASLTLLIGIGSIFLSQKEYLATNSFAQINLPDGSAVKLSPGAKLSHARTFGWTNRELFMEGEVSYQVTKGKPFIVNTKNGTVEVLGTAFRVIHTDGYFEVLCAEGKVKVTHQEETYFLTKGLSFNTIDQQINEFEPTQFGNTSSVYYSKVPLNHVIHLIENLYNLNVELQSNKSFYFTGVVPLNNKEKAIKSISLPFSFGIKEGDNGNLILIEE